MAKTLNISLNATIFYEGKFLYFASDESLEESMSKGLVNFGTNGWYMTNPSMEGLKELEPYLSIRSILK